MNCKTLSNSGDCSNWQNKNGTSDRNCSCGTWKEHWQNFSNKKWPETCSVQNCDNKATLGAHIINSNNMSGEWIAPFCSSCNKRTDIFSLKPDTTVVSANKDLTCEK